MKITKDKLKAIIFTVITIAGVALLLYPTVSDVINSYTQSRVIEGYSEYADKLSVEDYEKAFSMADDYNKRLYETEDALLYPDRVSGYDEVLDVNSDGVIGFVEIERISVYLPIYHSTNDTVLNGAVGHLWGSSFPSDKGNVHSVIAGHRGLMSSRLFTDINKLEEGDEFSVTVLNRKYIYEVDKIQTVLPEEDEPLRIEEGKNYVTLQTCTPYGVNSHRLLVRGKYIRTEDAGSEKYDTFDVITKTIINRRNIFPVILGVLILLIFVVLRITVNKRRAKKRVIKNND